MARKTITLDLEAYETLARQKGPGQSFSEVIRERLGQRRTARDRARIVATLRVAPETLDAVDRVISTRGAGHARAPRS